MAKSAAARPRALDESQWALLALVLVAVVAGLLRLRPVHDPDLPWHLDQAEAVLRAHTWRTIDDTSFTLPGAEYINHPWLGGVILYGLFKALGWAGPVLLSACCAAATTLAAGFVARRAASGRPWLAVSVAVLAAGASNWRFGPRPHVLFLLIVPLAMLLAERFARAEGAKAVMTRAALLLALGVTWAQLHASYLVLSALVAIALLGQWRARGLRWRRLCMVPALLGLVFVAPGGLHTFSWIAEVGLGDATSRIVEMKPLELRHMVPESLNFVFWLDALIAVALLRSLRAERLRIDDAGHALLGLALALTARRFVAVWALLLVPLAARAYAAHRPRRRALRRERLVALLLSIGVPGAIYWTTLEQDPAGGFALGLDRDYYAVDAALLLEQRGVAGKLFNEYNDGGWLALQLAPKITLAIDGRTPNYYDAEHFYAYRTALRDSAAFAQLQARYQPDMALPYRQRPLCAALAADPRWRASYLDARRTLFVLADRLPSLPRLEAIDPCDPVASIESACAEGAPSRSAVLADVDMLVTAVPQAPYPHLLRARFELACGGDLSAAIAQIDVALAAPTRDPEAFQLRARAWAAGGHMVEALADADRAVGYDLTWSSQTLRARMRLAAKDPEGAVADLEPVAADLGDELSWDLRLVLARALAGSNRPSEAITQARRAQRSGGGPAAAALLQELGAAPRPAVNR